MTTSILICGLPPDDSKALIHDDAVAPIAAAFNIQLYVSALVPYIAPLRLRI